MNDDYHWLTGPVCETAATRRVIAIGKFDGVHIGHQAILAMTVETARREHGVPCIFTFAPHPRFALTGDLAYQKMLTPPRERVIQVRKFGIEETFVADFSSEFQSQSAEEFVVHYLVPLGAVQLIVGFDFRFGKLGAYTAQDLARVASSYGIGVQIMEAVNAEGLLVSSSRIRQLLDEGRMEAAEQLLGRHYVLRGEVVHGQQRGRTIGYPTANIRCTEPFVIPRHGVYAVNCYLTSQPDVAHPGMMNIGVRPTVVQAGDVSIEVHVFDFHDDLYGQQVVVELLDYIREERAFASLSALVAQIKDDERIIRQRIR